MIRFPLLLILLAACLSVLPFADYYEPPVPPVVPKCPPIKVGQHRTNMVVIDGRITHRCTEA